MSELRTTLDTTDWYTPIHETIRIKQTIRLIVNSRCNFECSYPVEKKGNNKKWCHAEGIEGFDPFSKLKFFNDPETSSLLRLGENLRRITGIDSLRLAGLEPTLRKDLVELISSYKNMGFRQVGITTNGSKLKYLANEIINAGLDEVNISIHSLNKRTYARITGVDCLDDVLDGIKSCKEAGLNSIKINCVLLRREGMKREVRDFLKFAADNKIILRFYQLFWLPSGNSWVERYQVSWQHYYPLWKPFIIKTNIQSATLPMRRRITFELSTGATVQVDHFDLPKSSCVECQKCPYQFSCEEGLLGCGLRVIPDLKLSPCLYRDELKLNLQPLCDNASSKQDREQTELHLRDRLQSWGVELPQYKTADQLTLV